ncbi:hypothetical protein GBAR_LOCUS6989 [Geodia barretti]|uniref:Uncharacterized protein n=1 Tax=Geodia barretti TaxID=519541 RepID=A0AA35RH88_GEOBA|nr:hypothetical protein GBAR_LOCUS6989 [Geodia barretti]
MTQQQENPIYWDQSATRWNLTLIFSLVVAVLGIVMTQPLLIILGLGMAIYSWLTTPRQFLLYRDSMVIVYGMPRTRVISFAEISHIELLALPLGERLRIRLISGGRVMLMMRDPGAFRGHLEDALARYHGEQSGTSFAEGTVLDRSEEPEYYEQVEAESVAVVEPEEVLEVSETATAADTAGSYSEAEEEPDPATAETYSGYVEEASSTSGSYTETAQPDFSGEGRSAFSADTEFDASSSEEDDTPERPRSPY